MKSRVERSQWLLWGLRGEVHCPLCLPCMVPSAMRWEERRKHVSSRECPRTASFSHFRVLLRIQLVGCKLRVDMGEPDSPPVEALHPKALGVTCVGRLNPLVDPPRGAW